LVSELGSSSVGDLVSCSVSHIMTSLIADATGHEFDLERKFKSQLMGKKFNINSINKK
jgi:hypothetical protein